MRRTRELHGIVVLTGTDYAAGDNHQIINLARAYGIRALGPDALGVINTLPTVRLNGTPGPMPRAGGVGLFCQSAAVGVALAEPRRTSRSGSVVLHQHRRLRRRHRQRCHAVLGGRRATRVCLLTLDSIGNPEEVLADRPAPGPEKARRRLRARTYPPS